MKIGSLFTGYGGLDMALAGEVAWYCETDPAAQKVLKVRYADKPNYGDVRTVDWSSVERVDVLAGGYPCQPFSHAGQRKGALDERNVWPHFLDAIRTIRPKAAVLENVRGHLSLGFDAVLSDLAGSGYAARWCVARASDAAAPHLRARLFAVAYPDGTTGSKRDQWSTSGQPTSYGRDLAGFSLCTETTSDPGRERHGGEERSAGLGRVGSEAEVIDRRTVTARSKPVAGGDQSWGEYAEAIGRWERTLGRSAPSPVVLENSGTILNARFVEWMMGLPDGWVTDIDLRYRQKLALLGNGVVPQQARLALSYLERL